MIDIAVAVLSEFWLIILLFFVIAVLYSSVGFGGGSSYLAVLALSGLFYTQIRFLALLCNIAVVTSNVIFFQKQKQYDWIKILPLVVTSIPLAFLGGYLKLTQAIFFILLGFTLLFAALSMWLSRRIRKVQKENSNHSFLKSSSIGGLIGFLSGLVGIGGGIFLAPLLHLIYWDSPKKIAAVASFFILVNSISGLTGQFLNADFLVNWPLTLTLILTVLVGGLLGNKLRNSFLSPIQLKKATAILIAFVSIRILIKYLF